MKDSSIFKYLVIGVFAFFGVLGVIFLAGFSGGGNSSDGRVAITLWGTADKTLFNELSKLHQERSEIGLMINYVEKNPRTFEEEFVNALAAGRGPDAIIAPTGFIFKHRDKIYPIPYESLSERRMRDTYIEAGELLMTQDGVWGIPFSVDPLVMYWNRDIFSNEGIANPPQYWGQVQSMTPDLALVDKNLNVVRAAVDFGEYTNIRNAKDSLSMLLLQSGNKIMDLIGENVTPVLNRKVNNSQPAVSAVNFYTYFADPSRQIYTWNRSLPDSQDHFVSGDLAIYFGRASEFPLLERRNPNLNFDVSIVPQIQDSSKRATYGELESVALVRNSPRISSAFSAAMDLSSSDVQNDWSQIKGLPPVRRDLLSNPPDNVSGEVFYESALISLDWIDILPELSDRVFEDMINSITAGRENVSSAINNANKILDSQLK